MVERVARDAAAVMVDATALQDDPDAAVLAELEATGGGGGGGLPPAVRALVRKYAGEQALRSLVTLTT